MGFGGILWSAATGRMLQGDELWIAARVQFGRAD